MSDSHSSKRPVFIIGIVGVVIVSALMLGVTFLQAGSNVSEVSTTSSSYLNTSSYSSSSAQGTSSISTSSSSLTSTTSTYNGPTGILGVSLTDPPIVPAGVTDVYISYSSVEVHVGDAGNEDGWYVVADSGSVDLMSLVNVSLTLGSAEVQTGVFNLISFNITSADVTINGANVTAYVPANRINVPIVGGISVSTGNSSGVLVDLSPEVIPYQNGTSISYVLVPEARSLPIPSSVWNRQLQIKGAELQQIQNQTWVTNASSNVVITGVSVSPNSFSLTLQNQGTSNASFSSIVIGQVVSLPVCKAPPYGGVPRPALGNVSSYVSVSPQLGSYVGNATVLLLGQVYPAPVALNTTASVVVTDPNGMLVESMNASVEPSGAFQTAFVAGGLIQQPWVAGTYNVTVNYNGTIGSTTFGWTAPVVTTTTESYTNSTTFTGGVVNTTTVNLTTTTLNSTQMPPPRANITVMTNATSYFGSEGVMVYGMITPSPTTANFSVNIRVIGPEHFYVFSGSVMVSSDGSFNVTFPAGNPINASTVAGRPMWVNGTYTVYAYQMGLVGYTKFSWSGNYSLIAPYIQNTTSANYTQSFQNNNFTGRFQRSFCGLYGNQSERLPPSIAVAYYAVFANGTLYPVNFTSLILATFVHDQGRHNVTSGPFAGPGMDPLIFTLAPGQSVTFTYNGTVDSLTGILLSYLPRNFAVPSTLFQINPGQEYTVIASGPFDQRIATVVNATSTA